MKIKKFKVIISKSRKFLKEIDEVPLNEDSVKNENSYFEEAESKSNLDTSREDSPKKGKENEEEDEFARVFEPLIEIEEWLIAGFLFNKFLKLRNDF